VPTVDRDVRTGLVWSIAIAGGTPSTRSTAGPIHAVEKLACVRAERLDVAALPFGVQGVEHQARLAGPRGPGDHRHLAGHEIQVEVLQIVLTGTADADDAGVRGAGSGHGAEHSTEKPVQDRTDVHASRTGVWRRAPVTRPEFFTRCERER
jgi:hypothetical protein